MKRLRLAAAALVILTALIDALFSLVPGIGVVTLLCLAAAAACLAAVAPFEALDPPARKRVLAACVAYVAAIAVASWFALQAAVDKAPLAALILLATCGLGLACWAFVTRNRRRRPGWGGYYDF